MKRLGSDAGPRQEHSAPPSAEGGGTVFSRGCGVQAHVHVHRSGDVRRGYAGVSDKQRQLAVHTLVLCRYCGGVFSLRRIGAAIWWKDESRACLAGSVLGSVRHCREPCGAWRMVV